MKYVFIVGCPRSGTTWLRMLLAQHAAIVSPRETHLFDGYIAGLQAAWERGSTKQPGVGLQAALTEDQFTALCAGFARGAMQHIAGTNPGAKVLVEKTPAHVRHVPLILKLLPEAYFIHLVRDPRAAVASLCAAGRTFGRSWASADPVENARRWVRDVSAGCGIASLTNRSTTVKYEALLEPTGSRVLQDLFKGIGLEAEEDFCQQAMAECTIDRLREKRDQLKSRGMASTDGAEFFRKGKADSWTGELSPRDVEVIEYITGDLMQKCGYITSTKSTTRHRNPWRLKRRELLSSIEWRVNGMVAFTFGKLRHRV